MQRFLPLSIVVLLVPLPAWAAAAGEQDPNSLTADEQQAGWRLLFDGRTTDGWRGYRATEVPASWRVENGSLLSRRTAGESHGDLVTVDQFGDFELMWEWKMAPGGNSGVIYRATEEQNSVWETGPEYQVLDNQGHLDGLNPLASAGACYSVFAPARDATRPLGQWNRSRIVARGKRVEHWMNGEKLLEYEIGSRRWQAYVKTSKFFQSAYNQSNWGKVPKGHIGLQDYGGEIEFRGIKIRELDEHEQLSLWSGRAPVGDGQFEAADATITVHRPPGDAANGAAVVICPGGGYGGLVTGAEGHGIARWLNGHGIAGIVLEYRLPHGRPFVPLLDAQRAIRTVRANAESWSLDPDRIGIIGFSAGGHLASTAGTQFDRGDPDAADPVERFSCRPNFVILVYPVVSMGEMTHGGSRANLLGRDPPPELIQRFSGERQVTAQTPPMFLTHALDDQVVVPDHSRRLYQALRTHEVPAELLELPSGGHGLNGYQGPMWDAWQTQALRWLAAQQLIP